MAAWGWLIMTPASGLGAGFSLFEAGARGTALGCAVVARADDLSAIFFNPAGLVQLPGFRVMGGFSFLMPHAEIVTHAGVDATTPMEGWLSVAPHFFTSYQLSNRVWLGLGLNSPFGLGIRYDNFWPGNANIIKAAIKTVNFNPSVAVKLTDYLSAGGGLDLMYFNFNETRMLPLPFLGPQKFHLAGDTWGVGGNFGLLLKPRDDISLGISYRSQVRQELAGPAYFKPYSPLDARVSGSIILPDTIFTGVMVRPLEKLSVEVGALWTHWSLFRNLDFKFENALGVLSQGENWHNTWRGQVGVEYQARPWLDLRAGYALENEPMPDRSADYTVPTTDFRHTFSCGAGFRWQAMTLDLAYATAYMPSRTVNNSLAPGVLPSTYQGRLSHDVVCTLGYKF
jgi:long-chain fatty acid transport protein